MATVKRTTRKTIKAAAKNTRDRQAAVKVATFLYSFINQMNPAPFADPALELLTRSQRLQLADFQSATGISIKRCVRRAVKIFLLDEAPIHLMHARR